MTQRKRPPCDMAVIQDLAETLGDDQIAVTAGAVRYGTDFMARMAARLNREETWN